jgi:hypothetical protein
VNGAIDKWNVSMANGKARAGDLMTEAGKKIRPGGSAKGTPGADYEVGYAKPPPEHRFKPGNNANPKGRRKGTKNRRVVVQDVLLEQITVREGSETKQMSKLEALLKKTISDALAGDKKAAGLIFAIAQKEGLLTPEQEEAVGGVAETDAAILDAYNRQFLGDQSTPDRNQTGVEPLEIDDHQPAASSTGDAERN